MSDKDTVKKISKKAVVLYALLCLIISTILCVLMAFFGSQIKLGSLAPFSDEAHRWYFIVVVIIIALGIEIYLLSKYLKAKRDEEGDNKKIKKTVFTQLDDSNQIILDKLKKNTKIPTFIKRNVLYSKPWFFVLGQEASGKTALLNSFHLDDKTDGQDNDDELINWKLSNNSVFIDVKAAIWTKDNRKIWHHFIAWLSKKRAKRPINGIILTVSIDSFIHLSMEQCLQHAFALRKELNQLNEVFGTQTPVYIIVTKLDLLEGFSAFVNKLDGHAIDDVFGLSFPIEDDHGSGTAWQSVYQQQYDKLGQKLNNYLFHGQVDESTALGTQYYAFIQQIVGLREPIFEFIAALLGEKHTESKPLIRGVYFTSANQQHDVINAVKLRANDLYNLPADAPTVSDSFSASMVVLGAKSFFSEYLPEQLLIPEAGLASDSTHEKHRVKHRALLAYLITGLVIAGLTTGWLYFYKKNKATGQQVLVAVKQYHDSPELGQSAGNKTPVAADYINTLNLLRDSLERYRESQGVLMNTRNMGLYRGEKITARIAATYQQLLSTGFSKAIVYELVTELEKLRYQANKKKSDSDVKHPKDALALLRVIRLISESPEGKSKQDTDDLMAYRKTLVRPWMIAYWSRRYKEAANSNTIQEALLTHLDYALANTDVDLDESLNNRISKLQMDLSAISLSEGLYEHMKDQALAKSPSPFNLTHALGGKFYEVFQARANLDENADIDTKQDGSSFLSPRFFTRNGFEQFYLNEQDKILKLIGLDYWALGKKSSPREYTDEDDTYIKNEINALYLGDYTDSWEANINALEVQNLDDMTSVINFLSVVSSKDSPYLALIKTVRNHTIFTGMYPADGKPAADGKESKKIKPTASQKLAKAVSQQLQHDFQEINTLAEKMGEEKTYIEDTQQVLKRLHKYMLAIQKLSLKNKPGLLAKFEKKQAEKGVENPIDALQRIAEGLPEPFQSQFQYLANACSQWVVTLTFQDVDTAWQQGVYAYYEKHIQGKYPLSKTGADIPLANFKAFFAKNGILDKFYTQYVKKASEAAASETDATIDNRLASVLQFFEHVDYIRSGFFTEAGEYNINFSIEPVSLSNVYSYSVLDLHGEKIKYAHEKSVEKNSKWPAEGAKKSAMTFSPLDKELGNEVYKTSGEWALFRLLDKTSTYKLADQIRHIRFKGKTGVADFKLTVPNPVSPLTKDLFTGFELPATLTLPSAKQDKAQATYF